MFGVVRGATHAAEAAMTRIRAELGGQAGLGPSEFRDLLGRKRGREGWSFGGDVNRYALDAGPDR